MKYIKPFNEIELSDVALVGGKNASLGQMVRDLQTKGVQVPDGFAITADAYWHFLQHNNLVDQLHDLMNQLNDKNDLKHLELIGKHMRLLIEHGHMPADLADEIQRAYKNLSAHYMQNNTDVAVRSSATAEDLPDASFAGQQETFLNIRGIADLLESCKKCFASLFTDRAIVYRQEKGFDHFKIGLSIGVQKMVRSDKGCSGVAFSLDTETGFKDVVLINGSYGLGETIVQGLVTPDEYVVHKPTLQKGFEPIIKKQLGVKDVKLIYARTGPDSTQTVDVPKKERMEFCLTDQEILQLARMVVTIEEHYTQLKGQWTPMDVEWAKDGVDGKLYITQARPETVHAHHKQNHTYDVYTLQTDEPLKTIASGQSIGQKIVSGTARVITDVKDIALVNQGDIIVTTMTDPDWVPVLKQAAGIVTDRGGRTCHAAIVSRELGIPALVGAINATQTIVDGTQITIDCSQGKTGFVYEGAIPFTTQTISLDSLPELKTSIMVNIANPDTAFTVSKLPVQGVGLARMEFIINNTIKIHPMALLEPDKVQTPAVRKKIDAITAGYENKTDFFVDTLAQGIASIAAAFYPQPVIVRTSDFKTNEYSDLLGGSFFEPKEENPMLGFRGAFRYYNSRYEKAFALECAALKKVREQMGFVNVRIMVPFVRTITEAQQVVQELQKHGLERGVNDLQLVMMCELPSNVLLIDQFSNYFDGFSIGSNDLTQLTLGVDRDSELLAGNFDERDPAVIKLIEMAIEGAHANNKYVGICGQAPSDYPEVAQFVIDRGIDSVSLNPDSVIPFLQRITGSN